MRSPDIMNVSNNFDVEPASFAPSDVTITNLDMKSFDTTHKLKKVLREKVVLVGDPMVGKTCIARQNYTNKYVMTSNVDLIVKKIPIANSNLTVDLFLYDIGGHSILHEKEIIQKYLENCSYILCVFDISSRKSLQSSLKWIDLVRSTAQDDSDPIPALLVANKIDLREEVRN